jgi:hypothetical protein
MDIRRFYVVSPRGERGPFSVEELTEELKAGSITAQQQVRTGMGTMIGTVREVLAAPDLVWNPMDTTTAGLSAVVVAQRRNRTFSLVILAMTLVPATAVYLFLSPTHVAPPPSRTTSDSVIVPPPPPLTPSPVPVNEPAKPPPSSPIAAPAVMKPAVPPSPPAPVSSPALARSADVVRLTASTATVTVPGARLQGRDTPVPHIGTWNSSEGAVEWKTSLAPGRYAVTLTYACNKSGAGALIVVSAGGASCSEPARDHTSWNDFKPHTFTDPLEITSAGETTIQVKPGTRKSSAFMKLAEMSLRRLP